MVDKNRLTFRGQNLDGMRQDEFILTKYFQDKTDGFFVEAGASDGLLISVCKVLEDIGWSGINIEADPVVYGQLMKNRPNSTNINIALSNHTGTLEFKMYEGEYVLYNHAISSITQSLKDTIFMVGRSVLPSTPFEASKTQIVSCDTYANVIGVMNKPIDFMVLDVECHELEVIEGMQNCKNLPGILCVEYMHTGLDRIVQALTPFQYKLDWRGFLDAIFIREV